MPVNLPGLWLAVFWGAGFLLAYTFGGYAVLMRLLARTRQRPVFPPQEIWPTVTCVVVAFNEEDRIVTRVGNLLASDYPAERLRVVVVSDGSTDRTVGYLQAMSDARVRVIEQPERLGKASGLNAALAALDSDLVVLTDSRQRFAADTIRRLAGHFGDPAIGAVSGSLEIERTASNVGQAVEAYWKHEKELRAAEARFDSCIGCTGAVYALRRSLFVPLPPDTLLDDVVVPMQAARQGYRVLHDPEAIAFDPQPLDPQLEQVRKRRTLAGNFQMLFRYPGWLLPWGHRLWWQLISHKYLRLVLPLLLVAILVANTQLLGSRFFQATLLLQGIAYTLAGAGLLWPGAKARLLSLPAGFVFLNIAVVRAFLYYLTAPDLQRWTTQRKEPAASA